MQLTSIVAIFFLCWFLSLFFVLPFYAKTAREAGEEVEQGHAESAPHRFPAGQIALRTTILAAILFGLFYANYVYGWIGTDFLDFIKPESMRN